MGTINRMNLQTAIKKYVKTNQITFKDGVLGIIEKDKDKAYKIIWELSEFSPEISLSLLKNNAKENL